ncbi:MAG: discoidin domain-containing protein, partial [Polaribacter sp.]|nr:discoidin domain-containing protein [Polaribacter sp.]
PNIKIDLQSEYANQYNAGGDNALIDGVLGTEDFRTGTWQGYFDTDVVAIVDLGTIKKIQLLQINFLKDQRSWIFLPKEVEIYTSNDGEIFKKSTNLSFPIPENEENVSIETMKLSKLGNARYIKVIAKKLGTLPTWHLGYKHDGRSWLFIDEIQIK